MQNINVGQIKKQAAQLQDSGKKWHFHILTPECQLNETNDYALILENTTDNEAWICYSDKPYMGIGQELVKLLHGDDVVKSDGDTKPSAPSPEVEKLLERAKDLNKKGEFWHHHMLFPGCMFNKHQNKYVIIFEDQENSKVIKSITDAEPKNDLQHIEGLFYAQKK